MKKNDFKAKKIEQAIFSAKTLTIASAVALSGLLTGCGKDKDAKVEDTTIVEENIEIENIEEIEEVAEVEYRDFPLAGSFLNNKQYNNLIQNKDNMENVRYIVEPSIIEETEELEEVAAVTKTEKKTTTKKKNTSSNNVTQSTVTNNQVVSNDVPSYYYSENPSLGNTTENTNSGNNGNSNPGNGNSGNGNSDNTGNKDQDNNVTPSVTPSPENSGIVDTKTNKYILVKKNILDGDMVYVFSVVQDENSRRIDVQGIDASYYTGELGNSNIYALSDSKDVPGWNYVGEASVEDSNMDLVNFIENECVNAVNADKQARSMAR